MRDRYGLMGDQTIVDFITIVIIEIVECSFLFSFSVSIPFSTLLKGKEIHFTLCF